MAGDLTLADPSVCSVILKLDIDQIHQKSDVNLYRFGRLDDWNVRI